MKNYWLDEAKKRLRAESSKSSEVQLEGCDRASAKDFRGFPEVFILRAASVAPSTAQRPLKKRRLSC